MVDLAITATQVLPGTDADVFRGTAGATVTAGQPVYLDSTTGKLLLADANASSAAANVKGIALHGSSDGQPLLVQLGGDLTLGAAAAPAVGMIYVLSGTAGGIAPSADIVTGWYVTLLGVGIAGNKLKMDLFVSGALKP